MIGSQAWTLPLSGLVEISQSSESPCPACTFTAETGIQTTQLSHPTQSPIGAGSKSSATMNQLLDTGISHGQIHRLAQREGTLVANAWEALRQRVFGDGDRSVLAELERDVAAPALAVIQADGTFVHDRSGVRIEAKGGIASTGIATVSKGRRRLLGKRTYGSLDE